MPKKDYNPSVREENGDDDSIYQKDSEKTMFATLQRERKEHERIKAQWEKYYKFLIKLALLSGGVIGFILGVVLTVALHII